MLPAFAPAELAMTTYAFAALDFYPGQDCVDALADAALGARARLDPRALAHVLWNMSRLGYVDDPFYLAFVPGEGRGRGRNSVAVQWHSSTAEQDAGRMRAVWRRRGGLDSQPASAPAPPPPPPLTCHSTPVDLLALCSDTAQHSAVRPR